jgi:hypothetical protein
MTPDRKKPGIAFWATVALVVVLAGYPLSYGPAIWLANRGELPDWAFYALPYIYLPLNWLTRHSGWCLKLQDWYLSFWMGHTS